MEPRSSRMRKPPPRKKKTGILFFSIALPLVAIIVALAATLWNGDSGKEQADQNNSKGSTIVTTSTPTPTPSSNQKPAPATSEPVKPETTETPTSEQNQGSVTMTFVGDVMMSDKVEGILKKEGYDYPYTYVRKYFEQADFSIANLETPVTSNGTKQDKLYSYQSSPEALPPLAAAGIDLVNLANNHSMDRGPDGLLDTLKHLDEAGIKHIGAGHDIDEAYQHAILEKNGVKIAFIGLNHIIPNESWKATASRPGMTQIYTPKDAEDAIKRAKADADVVVVFAHWGEEREDMPVKYQKDLARRFIDAGADLIVGSHPHVLQGFEQYKGKWIAYSLGNFIFTTNKVAKTHESAILQVTVNKAGEAELSIVPVLTQYALPKPLTGDKADQLLKRISSISIDATVELLGDGTGKVTAK
ncbi:CapA family protein [Paenibacillus albiflavus]|uniref:CapA family protein n=1 Tax=Paenibacillus albiflavus TaxID=2545760 RepID=A0A4R4E5G2_9BACL|nr:CapA family protein [Paenibacillus albiflavus]TCZ74257.1 CapA family protein [Paenibacillus albiflavus]